MDPRSIPFDEKNQAAREHDCPFCGVERGTRCVSSGGDYYDDEAYVHIDRLISMWRSYYRHSAERETTAWSDGRSVGWTAGVEDARYTFENTLVYQGAKARDELRTLKEEQLAALEPQPDDGSVPILRSVPTASD